MAKTFVPINVDEKLDFEKTIENLKRMKADRVYIAIVSRYPLYKCEERTNTIKLLAEKSKRLQAEGFETAAWVSTLGYGGKVLDINEEVSNKLTHKRSMTGEVARDAFCSLDPEFVRIECEFIKEIAEAGIKMIMLDDELVQAILPSLACTCDLHLAEYRRRLGEDIKPEEIRDKVYTGGKSRYRDVWLDMIGDTLRNFCKALRTAVDEVDPDIRMGFCAGCTSFDLEGVDAIELSHILAGKNKPFLRFTGAPYWYGVHNYGRQSLQNIFECVRQQKSWCRDSGIEVFTEGDSYPHNRFQVPAVYVELFDIATKVFGGMDTLKYVMGYFSQPWYEDGYIRLHEEHQQLYKEIADNFENREDIGIRIYEEMRVIRNADLPEEYINDERIKSRWFMQASIIPSCLGIPTTYEGDGYFGMAFGENAKYLPESAFKKGLVLDVKAAQILESKGIDTGLMSAEKLIGQPVEVFHDYDMATHLYAITGLYDIKVNPLAKVISSFDCEGKISPSAYLYENKNGMRFMVYAFNMEEKLHQSGVLLSYCRGQQLNDCAEWLGGRRLPVECNGHPMLYCVCKEDAEGISVAYFNCHADEIRNADVKLNLAAKAVKFINCKGSFKGDSIEIESIRPYEFAGVRIIKG